MNKFEIKDNTEDFLRKNEATVDNALARMARDIKQIAQSTVPYRDGDLFNSARDEKLSTLQYQVIFDKEYAAYQERGMRKDGSHVIRKYTTPSTGAGFLDKAGTKVTRDGIEYLKQAASLNKYV